MRNKQKPLRRIAMDSLLTCPRMARHFGHRLKLLEAVVDPHSLPGEHEPNLLAARKPPDYVPLGQRSWRR